MQSIFKPLTDHIVFTGDLKTDIHLFLEANQCSDTATHCIEVGAESRRDILDAVGCHTTLRANSTLLDQVLFVADKISWDQNGKPPYINELNRNLQISLTHGAFAYINFLWERKETLKVIHPWLKEAYEELRSKCG